MLYAGNILSATNSGWISTKMSQLLSHSNLPISTLSKSILLLLPAIITLFITKGQSKKNQILLNAATGSVTSVIAFLWFIRTLSFEKFSSIESTQFVSRLLSFRDALIASGIVLSLLFMIAERKKKDKHDKTKK